MVRALSTEVSVSLQCYQSLAAGAFVGGAARDAGSDLVSTIVELVQGAYAPLTLKPDLQDRVADRSHGLHGEASEPEPAGLDDQLGHARSSARVSLCTRNDQRNDDGRAQGFRSNACLVACEAASCTQAAAPAPSRSHSAANWNVPKHRGRVSRDRGWQPAHPSYAHRPPPRKATDQCDRVSIPSPHRSRVDRGRTRERALPSSYRERVQPCIRPRIAHVAEGQWNPHRPAGIEAARHTARRPNPCASDPARRLRPRPSRVPCRLGRDAPALQLKRRPPGRQHQRVPTFGAPAGLRGHDPPGGHDLCLRQLRAG